MVVRVGARAVALCGLMWWFFAGVGAADVWIESLESVGMVYAADALVLDQDWLLRFDASSAVHSPLLFQLAAGQRVTAINDR